MQVRGGTGRESSGRAARESKRTPSRSNRDGRGYALKGRASSGQCLNRGCPYAADAQSRFDGYWESSSGLDDGFDAQGTPSLVGSSTSETEKRVAAGGSQEEQRFVVFRLARVWKDTFEPLVRSPHLAHCCKRVQDAGCELRPSFATSV